MTTAYNGNTFLLKDGTSGTGGTAIAAMRVTGLRIGKTQVDITNKDSGGWRELLDGVGTKSVTLNAEGVISDSATIDNLVDRALAGTQDTYGIVFGSDRTLDGSFELADFSANAGNDAEETYSVTLESSGTVTGVTP